MINYYGRFIHNLSTLCSPLHSLLRKDIKWEWSNECQRAFTKLKDLLASDKVLTHFNPKLPIVLACDASKYGVGAVLSHIMADGSERPMAFASRSLSPAEKGYSQIHREALGIIFGVKKYHDYLYGRTFTLLTDHQALCTILSANKAIPAMAAARLQRWAVILSAYTYDIQYRNTKKHCNCDALSRLPVNVQSPDPPLRTYYNTILNDLPVDAAMVARYSKRDYIISKVFYFTQHGWPAYNSLDSELVPYYNKRMELSTEQSVLLWGNRVVVPLLLRKRVLQELHTSHLGMVKMKCTARNYFWWPNLDADIERLASDCSQCALYRHNAASAPVHHWEYPTHPWTRLHIDLAGPFQGHNFLIVYDATTKWGDAKILSSTSSEAVIIHLRNIFSYFGLPKIVVSDNGTQFTSASFKNFMQSNGIRHVRSAPYHPRSNGAAERFVETFKEGMLRNIHLPIQHRICHILLHYRNTVHSTTNSSPAELMFGRPLRTKLDLLHPDIPAAVENVQNNASSNSPTGNTVRIFQPGDPVYFRPFTGAIKWQRGHILSRTGPLSYTLRYGTNIIRRHVDQLRSAPHVVEEHCEISQINPRSSILPTTPPAETPILDDAANVTTSAENNMDDSQLLSNSSLLNEQTLPTTDMPFVETANCTDETLPTFAPTTTSPHRVSQRISMSSNNERRVQPARNRRKPARFL